MVDKFCVSQMFYDTVEGPISRHPRKAEKVPWSRLLMGDDPHNTEFV